MFAAHIRRLYRTCDKIIIRNIRGRRFEPTGPNPGLDKRIKAFETDGLQITDNDAEEFVEQSESDFYKVGDVYNEHLNETLMGKHELRHRIIKEKYFKENMPNLLTWSEKEQIRHLANTEPDLWTPEKIAESFPITVPVVKKLLKYPWKPATEDRIARHDASVMRNWRDLKEGNLDIPKDLQNHFLKFSNRSIPPLNKKSIKIDITQERNIGEFERIIQRCATKEKTTPNTEDARMKSDDFGGEEVKFKKGKQNNRMTLDELTARIKKRLDDGTVVEMPDQIIVNTINSTPTDTDAKSYSEIELPENNPTAIAKFEEKGSKAKHVMDYPERIRIPKKAYKRGATYKVNDCYYDDDGRFLYRVLGMTN